MEVEEFQVNLSADAPQAEMSLPQQALWWAGKGAWKRPHECVRQREGDPDCDLVHAYLHRLEGDLTNAAYWYRRAGQQAAIGLLKACPL